jgi:hypothetical protein
MIHAAIIVCSLISTAYAGLGFPSVVDLEAGLALQRGGELPRLVVTSDGVFHAYYVGATSRGNGRYAVEVLLRR